MIIMNECSESLGGDEDVKDMLQILFQLLKNIKNSVYV